MAETPTPPENQEKRAETAVNVEPAPGPAVPQRDIANVRGEVARVSQVDTGAGDAPEDVEWTPLPLARETKERIRKEVVDPMGPLFRKEIEALMHEREIEDWEVEICGPNKDDRPYPCSVASIIAYKVTCGCDAALVGESPYYPLGAEGIMELIDQLKGEELPLRTTNEFFGEAVLFLVEKLKTREAQDAKKKGEKR